MVDFTAKDAIAHLEGRLTERLLEAFAADGWVVTTEVRLPGAEGERRVDGVACKGDLTYVFEVKTARDSRSKVLTALAAKGLLQARKYARLLQGRPMVVVGAPRLSRSCVRVIDGFLAEFGEDASWGVVDDTGFLELHGPGLQSVSPVSPVSPGVLVKRSLLEASSTAIRGQTDPFSDLGQWCIKVILSHLLPDRLQIFASGSKVDRPIRNANELAKIAGISVPTAWRTINALRESGLVGRLAPLELLRPDLLMMRWRAANSRQGKDLRTRWLFPSDLGALARLANALHFEEATRSSAPRRAVGLFAAAELRGYGLVRGVAPHLLHEDPTADELEQLGLTLAGAGESVDIFVRKPRFSETVYRGVTSLHTIPVADIFQVWLDVYDYPARGDEMASHLEREAFSRILPAGDESLLGQDMS